jgi:hypothetical protein
MRRRVFLIAITLVAVPAEAAHACSCAPINDKQAMRVSDGAFVGRLLSVKRVEGDDSAARYRYRVLRRYKGRMGDFVTVRSAFDEATCGLPKKIGNRYALYLDRRGRRWTSSLCMRTTPRAMRRAANTARTSGCS